MFASTALSGRTLQARPALAAAPIARRPFVIENAQKKGQGSTKNGRDSNAQRRGCKVYGGQSVKAGGIIFRQVGSTWYPGENAGVGTDFTIFSKVDGIVVYDKKKYKPKISVVPMDSEEAKKIIEASHTTKPSENGSRRERAREYFASKRAAKRAAAGIATVAQ